MKPLNFIPSYCDKKYVLALLVTHAQQKDYGYHQHPILETSVSVVTLEDGEEQVRNVSQIEALNDLTISGRTWSDPSFGGCPTYYTLQYSNGYCLDFAKLEEKYNALKKIHAAEERLSKLAGPAKTIGQSVCRLATILGCKKVITYAEETRGSNYSDSVHLQRYWTPEQAVNKVDHDISSWLQEQKDKQNPAKVGSASGAEVAQ